jgi:hypothetical protein
MVVRITLKKRRTGGNTVMDACQQQAKRFRVSCPEDAPLNDEAPAAF